MKIALKPSTLLHAGICLACLILTFLYATPYEASEFRGGKITGPILETFSFGSLVFLPAAPIALLPFRRISGFVTLSASLFCLPLHLYHMLPGPFRWIFGGEYSTPLQSKVVWEKWTILGTVCLMTAAGFGLRGLLAPASFAKPS